MAPVGLAAIAVREEQDLSGREIEGRYRVGRRLGKGASSVVYEARALQPAVADHGKRQVAVKVLSPRHVGDPEAVARFTHEAFLSSRLAHPALVKVVDFGWVSEGRPYFAMELCRGATLDKVLAHAGTLPTRMVVEIVEDAAKALATLHAHGLVHRDVKPANLFISARRRRPRVRLIDLGVAGVFSARRARRLGSVDVGSSGSYGTPAYIAPEQALGAPTDERTDVYALACVAYRALTGFEPFQGSTVAAMVQAHLFSTARPASRLNPSLPPAVDAVLARALAKAPRRRTPSVTRFAAELRLALRAPRH